MASKIVLLRPPMRRSHGTIASTVAPRPRDEKLGGDASREDSVAIRHSQTAIVPSRITSPNPAKECIRFRRSPAWAVPKGAFLS